MHAQEVAALAITVVQQSAGTLPVGPQYHWAIDTAALSQWDAKVRVAYGHSGHHDSSIPCADDLCFCSLFDSNGTQHACKMEFSSHSGGGSGGHGIRTNSIALVTVTEPLRVHEAVLLLTPSAVFQLSLEGPRELAAGTRVTLTVNHAVQCCAPAGLTEILRPSRQLQKCALLLHFGDMLFEVEPNGNVSVVIPPDAPAGP